MDKCEEVQTDSRSRGGDKREVTQREKLWLEGAKKGKSRKTAAQDKGRRHSA